VVQQPKNLDNALLDQENPKRLWLQDLRLAVMRKKGITSKDFDFGE